MLENTGLRERIREATLADGRKSAWTLTIDLGGYTTDFAMMGFPLDDFEPSFTEGTLDDLPRTRHQSTALGVAELDQRIIAALPPGKAAAYQAVLAAPNGVQLENLHRSLLGELKPYSLGKIGRIGAGSEMATIRDVIEQFSNEMADAAETFLQTHQYEVIDDLILTGGGLMIPLIRDHLIGALKHRLSDRAHIHVYRSSNQVIDPRFHQLDQLMIRGATAIGGASVYFD